MDYIYIIIISVLTLLLLIAILSRNKALRARREAEMSLSEAKNDLENVYSEVNTTQEELNAKYREIKAGEEKIKKLAYEDALTGMPNKAAFNEMLGHNLATLRKNEFTGIMYIDLDNFKQLDDLWGHANCDEFILDASHRLRHNLEEDDYLARMDGDGDGFMVLSQNLKDLDSFDKKVKRLIAAFRFPFITSFGQAVITVSIGATIAPKDGIKADTLLKNTTLALAEAKRLGKDNYYYYSEDLTAREIENIEFKSSLSVAIKNDSFFLRYEPVIDLATKRCDVVRAKLLWDRAEKGLVNAGTFIRFTEQMGQVVNVGINSLKKICSEMKSFPDKKVIMPITGKMFLNYEFKRQMIDIIDENGIDCSRFMIEIDEEILTISFSDCLFMMEELKKRGFGFAVGNYGNGKMSMDILRDMPIDVVTIPVYKIFNDHEDEEAKKYLLLVYNVIKELGIRVIFSHIDDSIMEDYVLSTGGKLVEGDLYGGYLNAKDVSEYTLM